MPATNESHESQARTRAFARFFGPLLTIVPIILAVRWPDMGTLVVDFFKSDLTAWFVGAALLAQGLFIIAFHQYWSSVAAVLISVWGWISALRGLTLMAAPRLYERAANAGDPILIIFVFGAIAAMGIYLTYVGWLAKPASPTAKNDP
jgi:hypothetical protein